MALFTILEPPNDDPDGVVIIKDGFSTAALIFTVLWALRYRMWVIASVLLAVLVVTGLSVNLLGVSPFIANLVEAGIGLIFGFEARRLRIMSLEKAGYRSTGIVEASTMAAAELQYFLARSPSRQPAPIVITRALAPSAHDTLGLFGNM